MRPVVAHVRARPRLVIAFLLGLLAALQSLLSFGFNTAILAFTVNLAASMF